MLGDPSTVTVTIADDDLPPEVSFAEAAVAFGESDGSVALGVEMSAPSALEVTVDFTAADGSATSGEDYSVVNGTLTIPAGTTSGTIPAGIIDDALDENDEDFTLSLSNPQSAVLGDPSTVTVTITDDDLPPEVMLTEAAVTVGEGDGTAPIGVELSAPSSVRSLGGLRSCRWFCSYWRGLHGHQRYADDSRRRNPWNDPNCDPR